ncbi:unnamed protein product [Brachionus calyciflorus]|uniref:Uncharacterized protein n=1 Tax=Brachionus calyciflorus TaxID=104777 RepID=A0A814N8H0_9BILA|nr:unnamed protein product [Brachionus calyciflorus]
MNPDQKKSITHEHVQHKLYNDLKTFKKLQKWSQTLLNRIETNSIVQRSMKYDPIQANLEIKKNQDISPSNTNSVLSKNKNLMIENVIKIQRERLAKDRYTENEEFYEQKYPRVYFDVKLTGHGLN